MPRSEGKEPTRPHRRLAPNLGLESVGVPVHRTRPSLSGSVLVACSRPCATVFSHVRLVPLVRNHRPSASSKRARSVAREECDALHADRGS